MALTSVQERFFLALVAGATNVQRLAEKTLAAEGITLAQYNLLRIIQNSPGITAGETRVRLMATAPSVAQLISQLESRGWIHRTPDTDDARKLHLTVSDKGMHLVAAANRAVRDLIEILHIPDELLASLTVDLSSLLSSLPPYGNS